MAITRNLPSSNLGPGLGPIPVKNTYLLGAANGAYQGGLTARNKDGWLVNYEPGHNGLAILGQATVGFDNSAGANGAEAVPVQSGTFPFTNSGTSPVSKKDLGRVVFAEDNCTVSRKSLGYLSPLGILSKFDEFGVPWVTCGSVVSGLLGGLLERQSVADDILFNPFVVRKVFTPPGAGAADITLFAADKLPCKLRILDVWAKISTADAVTGRLYDQASAGGTAVSTSMSLAATGKVEDDSTTSPLLTPGSDKGLFFHLSDGTTVAGEIAVLVAPEAE